MTIISVFKVMSEVLVAPVVLEHHNVLYTKDKNDFRNYENSFRHDIVYNRKYLSLVYLFYMT